jgi:hypothetical protein
MDKLVKHIATNTYQLISQVDYDSTPNDYIDRTNQILYWYKNYEKAGATYWQMRYRVRELMYAQANGFDDFKDSEKEVLGLLGLGNQTSTIAFYMSSKGLNQNDAIALNIQRISEDRAILALDAKDIVASPKMMQIGIKYLTWIDPVSNELDTTQANNLTNAIQGFLTELERYGLLGIEYGDEREGLMDYFESTNAYTSGGLKNYTFNPDVVTAYGSEENARNAMIGELQDIFVKGLI